MPVPHWEEIEAMAEDDVAGRFNGAARDAAPGVGFWMDVLVYKASMRASNALYEQAEEAKSLNEQVVTLTASLEKLTKGIYVLTVAAVLIALVGLIVALA